MELVAVEQRSRQRLSERLRAFAQRETRGSSPLYERLAWDLADRPAALDLYEGVDVGQHRANLLLAALHAVVLGGADHDLARYYPSVGGTRPPDDALADAAVDLIHRHRDELRGWMRSRNTQTNEVSRSAVLLAALSRIGAPGRIALVDVGASAGLNLLMDRYGYRFGDGQAINPGAAVQIDCEPVGPDQLPPVRAVELAARLGLDRKPLRVTDPDDVRWLRACVWPEHRRRRQLLDAAITEARRDPPPLVAGDAIDALDDAVATLPGDCHVVVVHCAVLAYVRDVDRSRFAERLARIARQRPLSWVSMEGPFLPPFDRLDADHPTPAPDDLLHFVVGLTEWPDGRREDRLLARADPHGGWLQWLDG